MNHIETPPRVVLLSCAGAPFSAETLACLYHIRPNLIDAVTGVVLSRKRLPPASAVRSFAPRTASDIALAIRYRSNQSMERLRRIGRRAARSIHALPNGRWWRIEDFCEDRRITPHYTRQPEGTETLAWLRDQAPDLLLMITFHHILRPAAFAVPKLGTFNVHASLLPAFRGPDPIGAALREGVDETGVTAHWVDAGIDTGDVVAQQTVPIPDGADEVSLRRTLARPAAELVAKLLEDAGRGAVPRYAQVSIKNQGRSRSDFDEA